MGPEFARLVEEYYGAYVIEAGRDAFNAVLYYFKEPALREEEMMQTFGGWCFKIVRHHFDGYTVDVYKERFEIFALVVFGEGCTLAVLEV